jgi:hypothetical protein
MDDIQTINNFKLELEKILLEAIDQKDEEQFYRQLDRLFRFDGDYFFKIFYPYNTVSINRKISIIEGVALVEGHQDIIGKIISIFGLNGVQVREYREINSKIEKNGIFFAIMLNLIENQVMFELPEKYFPYPFISGKLKDTLKVFQNLIKTNFQDNHLVYCFKEDKIFINEENKSFAKKLEEIFELMTQKKTKQQILKNIEDYFFNKNDNAQFLSIFAHVLLFAYIENLYSPSGNFCHIKMKNLSDIDMYLKTIAFCDNNKFNFHCLQAMSNYFTLKINFLDMNSVTPNFLTIYPVLKNQQIKCGVLSQNSSLLTVNLATFQNKIYIFYSSDFLAEPSTFENDRSSKHSYKIKKLKSS